MQKIKDDYDELTLAVLGGLGGDENGRAGPSDTLLRQLALLEQERRRDIAATMTPREFEDLELKESAAGRLVDRALKGTNVSDEQRREVFRLQREFELQFDGRREAAPLTYLEREQVRQRTQERIRAVLGEDLFRVWLAAADDLYAVTAARGVPTQIARDLMQTRDDYNMRVLSLQVAPGLAADQRLAARRQLAEETRSRAAAILGPQLYQTAHAELLTWLPPE
jgi:hypothetical protein